MNEAVMFWSSGKDSAAALQTVRGELEIAALVTTVNRPQNHVAVHRVPEILLDEQAAAIGLPLEKIVIPSPCPNAEYETRILDCLGRFGERGIDTVVFGDIHLADIRSYREGLLSRAGMRGSFPLWERDTAELAEEQIASGIRAVVTCVDNRVLDRGCVGREFDRTFVRALPETVDPCGENGEFHTFVFDASVFSGPVPFKFIRSFDEGEFSYAIIEEESEESFHAR